MWVLSFTLLGCVPLTNYRVLPMFNQTSEAKAVLISLHAVAFPEQPTGRQSQPSKRQRPPGHAWVLNMPIPKLDNANNIAGAHGHPARLSETAAAVEPTDKAIDPSIARNGVGIVGDPPMIGCFQIASIGARHASGVPDS
jgi:hypothetical protein